MITVPPPSVEISVNAGQFLCNKVILLCEITLPVVVSSEVTVATLWFGPSGQLRNSSNVTVSNTNEVTDRVFQSSVTLLNYDTAVNNGEYLCNTTVVPTSPYIVGISAASRKSVSISGLCSSEILCLYC